MIPIEILVMTSGLVGAIVIVVAARPGRLSLRWPRHGAAAAPGPAPEAEDPIRSGASLPPR
ncbi:hypothetical protein [Methylobacterium sp. WSM2598]|uniref:hypothetical protein n=1 Tax=Methylobacterium sp. WSM2598 TaxID=398261 RepID=UPI00036701B8|nr:hypothetical protein [Methylobacterium sp. WSM2598]